MRLVALIAVKVWAMCRHFQEVYREDKVLIPSSVENARIARGEIWSLGVVMILETQSVHLSLHMRARPRAEADDRATVLQSRREGHC